jgi:hypothetical protein
VLQRRVNLVCQECNVQVAQKPVSILHRITTTIIQITLLSSSHNNHEVHGYSLCHFRHACTCSL